MVVQELALTVIASGIVVIFVGRWRSKHNRRAAEAREWRGETIRLLTEVIELAKREIDRSDEIDFDRLLDNLQPVATKVKSHTNDVRGSVSSRHVRVMEALSNFIFDFEHHVRLYQAEDPVKYMDEMLDEGENKLRESDLDIDFDAPLEDGFPDILGEMFDDAKLEEMMESKDIEKEPELAELILGEIDDQLIDSGEEPSIRDLMDFPFREFAEFDEFEDLLGPGVDASIEQMVEVGLIKIPELVVEDIKVAQQD